MSAATWALVLSVYVACVVEAVEATTVVLAMGLTRGWRSTLAGIGAGLVLLTAFTTIAGYALVRWLPESALQFIIGALLLIFGLQWLRKAIYRSAGLKGLHDEDAIYATNVEKARAHARTTGGLDMFGFMVSLKAVFLEGMEVVFIVLTFGLSVHRIGTASLAAVAAVVTVVLLAVALRRPLSMIPENTMKYAVGLLLTSFGTFWAIEGLGVFRTSRESLAFPGSDLAILALIVLWLLVSRAMVALLPRRERRAPRADAVAA